ncbi:MAG TPA: TIGR03435 family protein [Candidatus Sulfopaludibacter sp.]|nr:TIGR03435 family protein [Candidatus Sulfopaludibacter sp.]
MKAACLALVLSALLPAQSAPPSATPKFDVVSIKRCQAFSPPTDSSPGRLATGCRLLADVDNTGLIQAAYNRYAGGHVNSFRIVPIEGGADWIHSEMFEIDARSDAHPDILMMQGPMMQAVLEDRFKLKIHRETRQGPVYNLALGKGSPKLKPFREGRCTPVAAGRPLPPLAGGQRYCRNVVSPRSLDVEGGMLDSLAGLLTLILDRPVIDVTGLTNPFEIHLVFSPDDSARLRPPPADAGAPTGVSAADAPAIFQAVQEQLGLKLAPAKGPVDVLVIDHIERPSGN